MKTLFFDCSFGAAGDMITAALLELFDEGEQAKLVDELNSIGIPGVSFEPEKVSRGGIVGTHMSVKIDGAEEPGDWEVHVEADEHHGHPHHEQDHHHNHDHEHYHEHGHTHNEGETAHSHTHRSHGEVQEIIQGLNVSDSVKEHALAIYQLIADAESKAHGCDVKDVHFHEVGKMDAIADVTAACYLIEKIAPEKIISSTIAVGNGYVKCAHGIMPVPAPATMNILEGVPITAGVIPTESCTPTGAAILKHFADAFGPLDSMTTEKVGYGMGTRVFPGIPGGLRAIIGESK